MPGALLLKYYYSPVGRIMSEFTWELIFWFMAPPNCAGSNCNVGFELLTNYYKLLILSLVRCVNEASCMISELEVVM